MRGRWISCIASGDTCFTQISVYNQPYLKVSLLTGLLGKSFLNPCLHKVVDWLCRYRSYRGYNYDASYTSHAHGWSSGPTSALTFYVLGLTVTSAQGKTWSVAPHTSGLSSAEGGFETPLGWYGVKWSLTHKTFDLSIDVPLGTSGTVVLPIAGRATIDGRSTIVGSDASVDVAGGKHGISVQL